MPVSLLSRENAWFAPLLGELTVTNLAHFSVLAVLTVHLVGVMGLSSGGAAVVLLATSAGLRFSRVLLAPFIDAFSPRRVVACAILLSLAGYAGMMVAEGVGMAALCMLLVGTGYGLNGMLVTTLASYTSRESSSAYPVYALMNTATNLAAALAPPLSNWLRLEVSPHMPFVFSALALCVSLLISLRIHAQTPGDYRAKRCWQAIPMLLKQRGFLAVLAVIALGWAVYTQKFSATPLFIEKTLAQPVWIGAVVAVNALVVLFISLPIAGFIKRRGVAGQAVLLAGFAFYVLAYGVLALWPQASGLWASLAAWSVGEALLMPQLNALVAGATQAEDRLAAFSLGAIAIGIGEAAGNVGGMLLFEHVPAWLCYAALAAFAAVTIVFVKSSGVAYARAA